MEIREQYYRVTRRKIELSDFDVKKNYSTRTNGASGKKPTQLVGTTNASSRLARKAQWRKTSAKSSQD
jgi:hypothetical protein